MHRNRSHSHALHSEWNRRMSKQKQHKRLPSTPWIHLPLQLTLERIRRWESGIVTLCSIWNLLEQPLIAYDLFIHRRSWFVSEWENAPIPSHDEGKKDVQLPPMTITTKSSHLLRARENEPLIRDEMEYTVLKWSVTTNQRRAVIESPHSWNPTELTVTAIPHESHLRCDPNKHTSRYQSEWRRHKALPVLTKRNACDYWMGDVSISNGVGEWTGPAIPTILYTLIIYATRVVNMWVKCLHRDNGLSNDDEWDVWHKEKSHKPLGDHLKKRWRAPMSIRERGMKWVLPRIVTSSL